MRREDIGDELAKLAFDFFYRYSRFEFALREHRFLRERPPGSAATQDWHAFATAPGTEFHVTAKAPEIPPVAPKGPMVTAVPVGPPFTFWHYMGSHCGK